MGKWRRKQTETWDAEQWFPGKPVQGVGEVNNNTPYGRAGPSAYVGGEGGRLIPVLPGDYVVTDKDGKRYVVRPELFEAEFEPVPKGML